MNRPLHIPFRLLLGLALCGLAAAPWPEAAQGAAARKGASARKGAAAPAPAPTPSETIPDSALISGSIWVSTLGSYYRDTPRIDRFVTDLRAKPFREAIIQVVENQSAFYNSSLLPKAIGIPAHFDPLAVLTKGLRAQPNAVRVIAWITPFAAGNVNRSAPLPPEHVLMAHPDWVSLRANGGKADAEGNLYLEPGLPEVQQYLESTVRELVRRYPIDGVYFDLMGDPDADWGYHPAMVDAWRARTGRQGTPEQSDPSWIALRAELIGKALDGLVRAARNERPRLMIGVGARTDGPPPATPEAFRQSAVYLRYHQDWPAWAAAAKPVSRLYLQDFKNEDSEAGAFDGWLDFALQACPAEGRSGAKPVELIVGVAGNQNESILTLGQMRKAIQAGAYGVALADYGKPVRDQESQAAFMRAVGQTVLSQQYYANLKEMARSSNRATSATRAAAASSTRTLAATGERLGAKRPAPAGAGGADLALPPPPQARRTPSAEAPASAATALPAGEEGEVRVKSQRVFAEEPAEAMTTATQMATAGQPATPATRHQMLEELMKDPEFSQSSDRSLIRPDDGSRAYLKEHYGNIFE